MVKKFIKTYARLKQEIPEKVSSYEVLPNEVKETLLFYIRNSKEIFNNKPSCYKFEFDKVFGEYSSQEEIFDIVAKPIINKVLNGYNGTIFAYGQTGSGKTYTMTGGSEFYANRGIIPRSIENVFKIVKLAPHKYNVCISYLEIYNEIGYDLLNPKHNFSTLEEIPKVALAQNSKGDFSLRNLRIQKVVNEQEAMKLLLIGDANRVTVETPMNIYSSRSHCIFTICITAYNGVSGKIRKSKLNLVDLAGSERVYKSNLTGKTLNEAKYINLSLHYLQQVILALSQRKMHVPFRNSMLTFLLKDSLSGNSFTVLIASLAVNKANIQESIATCKFAQRVEHIITNTEINQEIESLEEILYLRHLIKELRSQVLKESQHKNSGNLTSEEQDKCKNIVNSYLNNSDEEDLLSSLDIRHACFCFKLFKHAVNDAQRSSCHDFVLDDANNQLLEKYKNIIDNQEKEIQCLREILNSTSLSDSKATCSPLNSNAKQMNNIYSLLKLGKENILPTSDLMTLSAAQKVAFVMFLENSTNRAELNYFNKSIQNSQDLAKKVASIVQQCQQNIITMRIKLKTKNTDLHFSEITRELVNQQKLYKDSLIELENLKQKIEKFKCELEKLKNKLFYDFIQSYETDKLQSPDNLNKCSKKKCNIIKKQKNNSEKVLKSLVHLVNNKSENISYTKPNISQRKDGFSAPTVFNQNIISKENFIDKCSGDNTINNSLLNNKLNDNFITNNNVMQKHKQKVMLDNMELHCIHDSFPNNCYLVKSPKDLPFIKNNHYENLITSTSTSQETVRECSEKLKSFSHKSSLNTIDSEFYDYSEDINNRFLSDSDISDETVINLFQDDNFIDPRIFLHKNINQNTTNQQNNNNVIVKDDIKVEESIFRNSLKKEEIEKPVVENQCKFNQIINSDSPEFSEFMGTVPLTGDADIDEEIINFYRNKFSGQNTI